jgi:beta-glucosidase
MSFPPHFLWGASVSAHGAEGEDFESDWWHWEQRPNRIQHAETSKAAAGHYTRFREDIALAKKLGLNALLLSVSWARIQPEPDRFDEEALEHYAQVLRALRKAGIEPVLVLQEISLPEWFLRAGAWQGLAAVPAFERYVERVTQDWSGLCQRWIPIWEPDFAALMRYGECLWPPGKRRFFRRLRALSHQALAHVRAYEIIRTADPVARVGISVRGDRILPHDAESPWDYRAARREHRLITHGVIDAAESITPGIRPYDFIGVSYYGARRVRFSPRAWHRLFACPVREDGTVATPEESLPFADGLSQVIGDLARYEVPLLVTGNGLPTTDDDARCGYLLDHLQVLEAALQAGAPVEGYFHRALLDQFEWTRGYSPRYGLVHVARDDLSRTPNNSAYLYKDICESGEIRRGMVQRYCPGWQPAHEEGS